MAYLMKDYHPPGTAPGTLEVPSGEGANTAIHLLEYRGEQINVLTIQDLPQLARELADGQPHAAVAWVHVIGLGDMKLLQGLADLLKLHPLAMEDVTHLGQRPKVEGYDDIVFAILQYPSLVQREIKLAQIALFVGKNFVISFQPSGPDLLTPLRTRILATHARIRQADCQIRPRSRRHAHHLGVLQALHARLDLGLQRRVGQAALQHLGVFVGDHQHARATGQNLRQFGCVKQPFHCQVCYKYRSGQCMYDGG